MALEEIKRPSQQAKKYYLPNREVIPAWPPKHTLPAALPARNLWSCAVPDRQQSVLFFRKVFFSQGEYSAPANAEKLSQI